MRPQVTTSRAFCVWSAASHLSTDCLAHLPPVLIPDRGQRHWSPMPWPTTSRHERGYGTAWDKLRVFVLRRDMGLCQPCLRNNRTALANAVDHIVPKAKGGTDDMENLQAICGDCHHDKTLRDEGKRVKAKTGLDGWPEE